MGDITQTMFINFIIPTWVILHNTFLHWTKPLLIKVFINSVLRRHGIINEVGAVIGVLTKMDFQSLLHPWVIDSIHNKEITSHSTWPGIITWLTTSAGDRIISNIGILSMIVLITIENMRSGITILPFKLTISQISGSFMPLGSNLHYMRGICHCIKSFYSQCICDSPQKGMTFPTTLTSTLKAFRMNISAVVLINKFFTLM